MDTAIPRKLVVMLSTVLLVADVAMGQTPPFSATATARKSVHVTDPITGAASLLTEDSRDLTFQEYVFTDASGVTTYDPRYLTFATRDSSIDDAADRCTGTTNFQVYWLDDYNSSVRCVSANLNGVGVAIQGDGDSVNPKLGGPTDEEGRYVAFETKSSNLFLGKDPIPAVGEPTPLTQIVVHDRKFEQTWLSTGKNVATCYPGADRSQSLAGMSDDGSKLLFTTSAGNVINNLEPQCVPLSGFRVPQVYIRDGNNCDNPAQTGASGLGECFTSVLFDTYETHAGTNTVTGVDAAAANPAMNASGSLVVFDSLATTPTKYNPDISGYYDIYMHKSNKFSVLSRMQSPRCTLTGTLLPLLNDGSPANGDSRYPKIDGAGRYVAFQSSATNLVVNTSFAGMTCTPGNTRPNAVQYLSTGGFTQIYLYDSVTRKMEIVSTAYNSTSGGNGNSIKPWISRDAHYILYESSATNLLSSATTAHRNIFMYDRVQKKTFIVTPGTGGSGVDKDASITHVSNNGLTVAFQTAATNPVAATSANGGAVGANNTVQHVYLAQSNCPIDTDTDGVPDCLDLCANDSLKSEPGSCGCGRTEVDSDGDLTPNCIDACPSDANKVLAGYCGCGVAETDSDRDGVPDCADTCPNDNTKTSLGQCGCGVTDTDTDLDGSADCVDSCPSNPAKSASGTCACTDLKDSPGDCGCNVVDQDSNGNGASDCLDPTAATVGSIPTVDITRTTPNNKKAKYQLFAMLQKFSGRVSYAVSLTQGKKKLTKTTASRLVGFRDLERGAYTLSYTVSVGTGTSRVTSKPRTVTIRLPGGEVSSSEGRTR